MNIIRAAVSAAVSRRKEGAMRALLPTDNGKMTGKSQRRIFKIKIITYYRFNLITYLKRQNEGNQIHI